MAGRHILGDVKLARWLEVLGGFVVLFVAWIFAAVCGAAWVSIPLQDSTTDVGFWTPAGIAAFVGMIGALAVSGFLAAAVARHRAFLIAPAIPLSILAAVITPGL